MCESLKWNWKNWLPKKPQTKQNKNKPTKQPAKTPKQQQNPKPNPNPQTSQSKPVARSGLVRKHPGTIQQKKQSFNNQLRL